MLERLKQDTGIRAAETLFEPPQFHLHPAVAVRQLRSRTAGAAPPSWPGSPPCPLIALLSRGNTSLAPSSHCRFHWLTGIGSHRELRWIAQTDGAIGNHLLNPLPSTARLHGNHGPDLCAVGGSLAELLRRRLRLQRSGVVLGLWVERWALSIQKEPPRSGHRAAEHSRWTLVKATTGDPVRSSNDLEMAEFC